MLTTGGRFGGGCIRLRTTSAEETLTKTLTAPITGVAIVGAAIRLVPNITTSTGNNRLVQLADSAGNTHLTLAWSSADQLFRLYRGTTAGTLLATSAVTFAADAWGYLELKATIADAGGICVVRLDGAEIISFTGDTRNAGTAEVATVRFSSHFQSNDRYDLRLDDVSLCDDTGSRNNDLLGDVRVTTLRPNADTAQADLAPLGGGAHYLEVDDAPAADGDASYLESGTVGHVERLGLEDLAGTPAAILAVQLATVARKDDAGSRSLRAILKSGAVTANGAVRVLATSYTLYDDRFEADPATGGDWTKPAIDALEPGVEITA